MSLKLNSLVGVLPARNLAAFDFPLSTVVDLDAFVMLRRTPPILDGVGGAFVAGLSLRPRSE
jgi:hypothetical protein